MNFSFIFLILILASVKAQTVSIRVWCNSTSQCGGPFDRLTNHTLGVCSRTTDACAPAISVATQWDMCRDGVLVTINPNVASSSCTGFGVSTFLLSCNTCNGLRVLNMISYYITPICDSPTSNLCPPATLVPTVPPDPTPTTPSPSPPSPSTEPTPSPSSLPPSSSPPPLTTLPPPTPSPRPPPPPASLTHGPRAIGPASYVAKSGQLVNADVTLVEYVAEFDQELHYLEFTECIGLSSCPTPSPCAACNYVRGPGCGQSPSGPACITQCSPYLVYLLCTMELSYVIQPISFGVPIQAVLQEELSFTRIFSVYVPPGHCAPIKASVTVHSGTENIYIYMQNSDAIVQLLLDNTNLLQLSWDSYSPTYTICPETRLYPGSGQTVYILVTAGLRIFRTYPTNFSLIIEALPPVQPLAPLATPPPVALPFHPLAAEGSMIVNSNPTLYYAVTFSGPCPRYFGTSLRVPPFTDSVASIIASESTTAVLSGTSPWFDRAPGQARIALSFCPTDISTPTTVYFAVQSNVSNCNLFWTTDPRKFSSLPMVPSDLTHTSPLSIAKSVQHGVSIKCHNTQIVPPPTSGGIGPAYLGMLPPAREAPPIWPLLSNVIQDGNARVAYVPPLNITSYSPTLLHFIANTAIHQPGSDGSMWEYLWVPYEDLGSCHIHMSPSLVNANGLPCDPTPIPVVARTLSCSIDAFRATKASIDSVMGLLFPENSIEDNIIAAAQLDGLEFSDAWQGCVMAAESFFSVRKQAMVNVASTTVCTEPSSDTTCCSPDAVIREGPCMPRPGLELHTNRTLNEAFIKSLPESDCVATYFRDYTNLANAKCLDTIPYALGNHLLQTLPFTTCYDQTFGVYGEGQKCSVDDDCPSTPEFAGWCDKSNRMCRRSVAAGYQSFVDCLISSASTPVLNALYHQLGLPLGSSGADVITATRQLHRTSDCVSATSTDILGFQTHLGWKYRDRKSGFKQYCPAQVLSLTYMATLPQCMAGLPSSLIAPDVFGGVNDFVCNYTEGTFQVCNWDNKFTSANAAICVQRGYYCAMCYNGSTCPEVPGNLTEATCNSSIRCQLQNGSYVVLTGASRSALAAECASMMSCSAPCYDAQARSWRACASEQECTSIGGQCEDDSSLWHFGPDFVRVPGACLLPVRGTLPCGLSYPQYNNTFMSAVSFGCVLHIIASEQQCDNIHPELVKRWVMPATNAAECAALGVTCYRTPLVGLDGRMWPTWSASLTLPPLWNGTSSCRNCEQGQCQPYATWQPGRWMAGQVRSLAWLKADLVPEVSYQGDAFVVVYFSALWTKAVQSTYETFVISAENCRFNRLAPALEAAACSASYARNKKEFTKCLNSIPQNQPVAYGYVCKGETAALLAPTSNALPAKFTFAGQSAASCTSQCSTISLFEVSPGLFEAARPPLRLSSYWTPKAKGPPPFSKAFLSPRGALVGQVVGGGISNAMQNCSSYSQVTVCFPVPTYTPERDSYRFIDFASAPADDLSKIRPLEVTVVQTDKSWCAELPLIENDTVYLPIIRIENWESASPIELSKSAYISLIITSSGCAIVTTLCIIALILLVYRRPADFFLLVTFYLLLLICIATLIRAIYFGLLAGEFFSQQSTARDLALIELPTFLWFTAVTLIISFWFVMSSKRFHTKDVVWRVGLIFGAANLVMYALFVATIVAFVGLQGSKTQCQGRVAATNRREQQHIVELLYQSLLAVVAIVIGIVFAIVSMRLLRKLGKDNPSPNVQQIRSATYVGLFVAASFVVHAIYLLLLAITSPGVPQLALLVLLTEVLPAAVLVAQMVIQWLNVFGGPRPSNAASTTEEASEPYYHVSHSDM